MINSGFMKKIIIFYLFLLSPFILRCANRDTLQTNYLKLELVIPSVLIAYGVFEEFIEKNKLENKFFFHEVNEHFSSKTILDDYLQYTPSLMTLGANLFGIKGVSTFKKKLVLQSISALSTLVVVNTLKYTTKIMRPDNSSKNSFPSGHTATAFMGAEFARLEYWDKSKLMVFTTYGFAFTTGLLRIYNNKHWLSDVCAGAGIGILCTQFSYYLYPKIMELFNKNQMNTNISMAPFHTNFMSGVNFKIIF